MSFFFGGKESAAPVLVKHMASDLRWCDDELGCDVDEESLDEGETWFGET